MANKKYLVWNNLSDIPDQQTWNTCTINWIDIYIIVDVEFGIDGGANIKRKKIVKKSNRDKKSNSITIICNYQGKSFKLTKETKKSINISAEDIKFDILKENNDIKIKIHFPSNI